MDNTVQLDVLIVYSSAAALSALVPNGQSRHPFALGSPEEGYNKSYAYFLRECQKAGLSAGLAASADITGPGTAKSYWTVQSSNWVKMKSSVRSLQIFDKLSSAVAERVAERALLLSSDNVLSFNGAHTITTFTDKLQTFTTFPQVAIPTVAVLSRKAKDIQTALAELEALRLLPQHAQNFSEQIILKDRFGAGGNDVHKIDQPTVAKIQAIMRKTPDIRYIFQPFLLFDTGYSYHSSGAPTDIRLVFHNNELLQCYLRTAQAGDFRCNAHQGGEVIYITEEELPPMVMDTAQKVLKTLDTPKALFSLDFSVSNFGTVYLVEGNSGPGLSWDENMKLDEKKVKQMIRSIVGELAQRKQLLENKA